MFQSDVRWASAQCTPKCDLPRKNPYPPEINQAGGEILGEKAKYCVTAMSQILKHWDSPPSHPHIPGRCSATSPAPEPSNILLW